MTPRIIYHDFRSNNSIPATKAPASAVSLTAPILAKGRRLAAVNRALNIACITLCGACIAVSIFIFGALFGGM